MKKFILPILILLFANLSFSQKYHCRENSIFINNDTVGKITNIKCNSCKSTDDLKNILLKEKSFDSLSWLNHMELDIVLSKSISDTDKKNFFQYSFNSNCSVNYIDSLITNKKIDSSQVTAFNIDFNNKLYTNMDLSSQFLIKSAQQKNQSLIVGLAGCVVSSLLVAVSSNTNFQPDMKRQILFTAGVVGLGATIATLTIQIQSNNNLKKAGISLKLK